MPAKQSGAFANIQWPKIAAILIISFAMAGAVAAWKGKEWLTMARSTLGIDSGSDHQSFLSRVVSRDPRVVITMNAAECVDRYGRYAVETGAITVAEIQAHLLSEVPSLNLRELEHLTYVQDREGDSLVILSATQDLDRSSLIEELGRELRTYESVSHDSVHTGFLRTDFAIKFAFLNDRTLVLGLPAAVERFLQQKESPDKEPTTHVPMESVVVDNRHLMRFYIGEEQTSAWEGSRLDLGTLLRSAGLAASDLAAMALWGSIGSDFEITVTFAFESEALAQTFMGASQDEVGRFAAAIGGMSSRTAAEAEENPYKMHTSLEKNTVRLRIGGDFRELIRRGSHISETLGGLAGLPTHISELLSPAEMETAEAKVELIAAEDFQAQQLALSLSELHASAVQAGAAALRELSDVDAIIEHLHSGVKGDGIYQNYVFRLKVPSDLRNRIERFLTLKGPDLLYVPKGTESPRLSQHDSPANFDE